MVHKAGRKKSVLQVLFVSNYSVRLPKAPRQLSIKPISLEAVLLWVSHKVIPKVQTWAQLEYSRLALFVPVLFAIGIGAYFLFDKEPALFPALLVVIFLLWCMQTIRTSKDWVRLLLMAAAISTAGFVAAKIRTLAVASPVLSQEIRFADVEGKIARVEQRPSGWRVILEPTKISTLSEAEVPKRVRITWRGKEFAATAGDMIFIRATLSPPPPPSMVGGYEFARHLYFQKIGAVGYAVSQPERLPRVFTGGGQARVVHGVVLAVEQLRTKLFLRIRQAANGEGGAIIAAIVTGKREAIPSDAESALRDSGLAHLLAISGLHMGLATGLIFFGMRMLLVMRTRWALKYSIKKWAAVAALTSGLCYLIISGSGWSARRAFIMSSIIFIAILTDRKALSLRNVAVAAMIILLLTPEALLHPGFQMSFAAVTALIAAYEWGTDHRRMRLKSGAIVRDIDYDSWWSKLKRYSVGIAITDTVAALATAPFALFHFHRTAIYSLPANMIAMPLMGLWIMPAIIMAFMVMPFGLDGFFWRVAALGIDAILSVGRWVSGLPGATSLIPDQSMFWLLILCTGGVLLCLLRAPWRFAGLLAVPVAIVVMAITPKPTLLISDDGQNAGVLVVHDGQKQLAVFDRRRGRFTTKVWMENLGFDAEQKKPLQMRDIFPCDESGCILTIKGQAIAISSTPTSLGEDCVYADIVVAMYPVNRRLAPECKSRLLDRRGAWEEGGRSLWIKESGKIKIRSVMKKDTHRPWQ